MKERNGVTEGADGVEGEPRSKNFLSFAPPALNSRHDTHSLFFPLFGSGTSLVVGESTETREHVRITCSLSRLAQHTFQYET